MDEARQQQAVDYVLGDLAPAEAAQFESSLSQDSELSSFTREMYDTVARIGLASPVMSPPHDLAARITREKRPRNKVIPFAFVPWALAACLAAGCFVLGYQSFQSRGDLAKLQAQNSHSQEEIANAQRENARSREEIANVQRENTRTQQEMVRLRQENTISRLKTATLQAQVEAYTKVTGVVIWNAELQEGVMRLEHLPKSSTGKNYQMWAIDPKIPKPVSLGLLQTVDPNLTQASFKPPVNLGSGLKFAVSIEPTGGSPSPTGNIVLVGQ